MDDIQQILIHKEDHTYIKVEAARRNISMRDFVGLLVETFKEVGTMLDFLERENAAPVSEDK